MITLDREVKFAEHKLIKLVKHMGNSESLFFFSLAIALFSGSERVTAEGQGSKNVPSNRQGQVIFGFGQVTFLACLSDGQGYEQAAALTGSRKLVKNNKTFSVWNISDCNFTWNESKGVDDRQRCNTRRSKVFKLLERLHYARPISIQCRNYQWTTWKKGACKLNSIQRLNFLSTRLKSLRGKDMTHERGSTRLEFNFLWVKSEIGL